MELKPRNLPKRRYEIDILRFIASISTVFYHYTFRGFYADNYSPIEFGRIGKVTRYGYLGVELFFMISGYVILLTVQKKNLKQFLSSRIVRLYPAFWIACTLTFLFKVLFANTVNDGTIPRALQATVHEYIYNLTMLYGFWNLGHIDTAYWSLEIEITFYFLISLLLSYNLLHYVDLFVAFILCILLVSIVKESPFISVLFFPKYASFFMAGMLFYMLEQENTRVKLRIVLLIISFILCLLSAKIQSLEFGNHFNQEFSLFTVFTLVTVFFICFILIITNRINVGKHHIWVLLGNITYPLYLIHSDIGFITLHRLGHLVNKYVLLFVTSSFMIIISYIIYRFCERPLAQLLQNKIPLMKRNVLNKFRIYP